MACVSVGVDTVIDPQNHPLLLGFSFSDPLSGRAVGMALQPDSTLELSSMSSPPTLMARISCTSP